MLWDIGKNNAKQPQETLLIGIRAAGLHFALELGFKGTKLAIKYA
jgi:hypothetical protein